MPTDFQSAVANIPRGLTLEERERAQQIARKIAKVATVNQLKLARARIADVLEHHGPWIAAHPDQAGKHEFVQLWIARGEVIHELIENGHRPSFMAILDSTPRLVESLTGIDDRWRDLPGAPSEPPPKWQYYPQLPSYWAKLDREHKRR